MKLLATLFFIVGFSLKAWTYQVPALTGPVIDEVGLLSSQAHQNLTQYLIDTQKQTTNQIQVYVAKSLQGEEIEQVSIQLFDKWKLGTEKKDNGIIFIVAPNEKKMRIEVGQGLEGDLPDVVASRIIYDVVRPHFQRGEFEAGIIQGVQTIQRQISQKDIYPTDPNDPSNQQFLGGNPGTFFGINPFFVILILIFIIMVLNRLGGGGGGYRGGWYSGGGGGWSSGGGGGWSGGGGGSSGGGASGGW